MKTLRQELKNLKWECEELHHFRKWVFYGCLPVRSVAWLIEKMFNIIWLKN